MTTPNQQHTLREIAHLTETIATNYRAWHQHWTTPQPEPDTTNTTTPTRQQTLDLLDQITRDITTAKQTLERAAAIIAATTPTLDQQTHHRCARTINPTCTNIADGRRHKTGLCDRCWQIDYRNRRQQ